MAHRAPFWMAYLFLAIAFILCCVAFGTGYWFEAEGEDRLFRRLGLWEACFDGYEHTSDYIGKAYYGCWWIFHQEYSYIREWILPPWFVGVQTLMTFGLCFQLLALILFPGAGRADNDTVRREKTTCFVTGLAFACLCCAVVTFGTMIGVDRTWMPLPDQDRPGWSFGLAVLSGFLTAFATICIAVYTMMRDWEHSRRGQYGGYATKKGSAMPMVPKV